MRRRRHHHRGGAILTATYAVKVIDQGAEIGCEVLLGGLLPALLKQLENADLRKEMRLHESNLLSQLPRIELQEAGRVLAGSREVFLGLGGSNTSGSSWLRVSAALSSPLLEQVIFELQ